MKLYIVINKDINMSTAKLGVQIGHACTTFTLDNFLLPDFLKWYKEQNQVKILLEAPEKQLLKLEELGYITIRDAGKTELEPNTLTCVVLGLGDKEKFTDKIKEFKRWRLA
jgi:PTH2 family peptidyl-tRNA hydrolase